MLAFEVQGLDELARREDLEGPPRVGVDFLEELAPVETPAKGVEAAEERLPVREPIERHAEPHIVQALALGPEGRVIRTEESGEPRIAVRGISGLDAEPDER